MRWPHVALLLLMGLIVLSGGGSEPPPAAPTKTPAPRTLPPADPAHMPSGELDRSVGAAEEVAEATPVAAEAIAPATATLHLRVQTAGGPGSGAMIEAYEESARWRGTDEVPFLEVFADEMGLAEISEIPLGQPFSIEVSRPGSVAQSLEQEPFDPGETREEVVLLQAAGHVAGVVLDESGRPISEATVWLGGLEDLMRPHWRGPFREALTDRWGRFQFADLPPGRNTFLAWAEGFLVQQSPVFRIVRGQTTTVELSLIAGARHSGRVVYEDGTPVEGVELFVENVEPSYHLQVKAKTDRQGRFEITGIPPGRVWGEAWLGSLEVAMEVDSADELPETWTLPRGGHLRVTIQDESGARVEGARVWLEQPGSRGSRSVRTDAEGLGELTHLLPGIFELHAEWESSRQTVALEIRAGLLTERSVTLESPPRVPDLVRLLLEIQDPQGNAIPGVEVQLSTQWVDESDSAIAVGITDGAGRVVLEYPADDRPSLLLEKEGWATTVGKFEIPNSGEASFLHTLTPESILEIEVFEGTVRRTDAEVMAGGGRMSTGEVHRFGQLSAGEYIIGVELPSGLSLTETFEIGEQETLATVVQIPPAFEANVQVLINGRPAESGNLSLSIASFRSGEQFIHHIHSDALTRGVFRVPLNYEGSYWIRYEDSQRGISYQATREIHDSRPVVLEIDVADLRGQFFTPDLQPLGRYRVSWGRKARVRRGFLDEEGRFALPAFETGWVKYSVENAPADVFPHGGFLLESGAPPPSLVLERGRTITIRNLHDQPSSSFQDRWTVSFKLEEEEVFLGWMLGAERRFRAPQGAHVLELESPDGTRRVQLEISEGVDEYEVELWSESEDD